MRRRAAFLVSIVTLGRPLVLYFGFWPTLPLLSTATGMLAIFEFNPVSLAIFLSVACYFIVQSSRYILPT